ncbi:hypothetical protein F4823DRAFT_514886 [Ustulina deusta]|nr:hypothetical protein F4823DRAFT_514886 [Ustulina deusta]
MPPAWAKRTVLVAGRALYLTLGTTLPPLTWRECGNLRQGRTRPPWAGLSLGGSSMRGSPICRCRATYHSPITVCRAASLRLASALSNSAAAIGRQAALPLRPLVDICRINRSKQRASQMVPELAKEGRGGVAKAAQPAATGSRVGGRRAWTRWEILGREISR